jgi:tRNA (guanine-N7-)-methyltransferase
MTRRLKDYPEVRLNSDDLTGPIDFAEVFGRSAPVHIEIGSGKGTFLVGQAQAELQVNFLGIEWANRYYRYAVDRIGRWDLKNVKLIRTDAADFLIKFVPDRSVTCYHIYYPDPWPKKRHHKRRFICAPNIEHLIRTLVPGGIIQIATDHEGYFEQIRQVLAERKSVLEEIEFTRPAGVQDGETIGTNYERKYIRENRKVCTLAVKRIS